MKLNIVSYRSHLNRRVLVLSILVTCVFTLSGCLISSHSSESETGTRIGTTTLEQIEPGSTTQDWVFSVLGEPTRKDRFAPNEQGHEGEIWVYEWQRTKTSSGGIIFIIGTSSHKTDTHTQYIEFIDGVVSRSWNE